jgi:hypothetical protein
MASRQLIDRLSERTEALIARLRPPGQIFQMEVENHISADAEIAVFCKQHGVTDNDMVIARIIIPYKKRSGETAREAYERELREAS